MTIAFSTRSLDWTTRYSFSADEFGVTDEEMVSFVNSSSIAWEHDKTDSYNSFHGTTYPSEIEIVTNEDPSAGKIYEAFSVESTAGNWSGEFITETGETQASSFSAGSLVEKEGKHYIDVPKSSSSIDPTIKYVGKTTIGNLREAQSTNSIKIEGKLLSVPNTYLLFALPSGETPPNGLSATAWTQVPVKYRGNPYFYYPNFDPPTSWSLTEVDDFVALNDEFISLFQPTYDAAENTINFPITFQFEFDNSMGAPYGMTGDEDDFNNLSVSIYTTSGSTDMNGEDMRGEYMRVKISREGSDYYELYCVNIDQHKTRLDHSLGQNN
jgi:hypothetical protein